MYLKHFKLLEPPFSQRLDPRRYFPSQQHQRAFEQLRSIIERALPCAVLSGPPGSGKSLLASVLGEYLGNCQSSVASLDLVNKRPGSPSALPGAEAESDRSARFLDGADLLSDAELYDCLKIAERSSAPGRPGSTVVLIGLGDLAVRVKRLSGNRQNRIESVRLGPLVPHEVGDFISGCLRRAGGPPSLFDPGAINLVWELTCGIPRRILRLADRCLLVALDCGAEQVDETHVELAHQEMTTFAPSRTPRQPRSYRWRPLLPSVANSD